jgi:hypothetical protein
MIVNPQGHVELFASHARKNSMGVTNGVIFTKRPVAASGKISQGKEHLEDCNTHKESARCLT